MSREFYMVETFFPTAIIDTESEYYKSIKPSRQCLLKTRIKRGAGKGRVRFAWSDTVAHVFRKRD